MAQALHVVLVVQEFLVSPFQEDLVHQSIQEDLEVLPHLLKMTIGNELFYLIV